MHHIATYLLRSRIDNISATMTNLIFADPSRIHISDLIDRNPFGIVRTFPGTNLGQALTQLPTLPMSTGLCKPLNPCTTAAPCPTFDRLSGRA